MTQDPVNPGDGRALTDGPPFMGGSVHLNLGGFVHRWKRLRMIVLRS